MTLDDPNAKPSLNLIGSTLDDRYFIERELGRGGVGVVCFARDRKLHDKPVVVKILLEEFTRSKWVVLKFQQEKEALARVDHPGVVGILDCGELPDHKPYIVMQYVEGESLRSVIEAEPTGMDLVPAAAIIKQIGAALSAVHNKNIYHRDLKPENIMLQRLSRGAEQVKIVDFGIAKVKESVVAQSVDTERVTAGTINYMSPEQLRGEEVTAASDIYSLGVITYEMVTGKRPFYPSTIAQLAEMHREGVRIKPCDLRHDLPEAAQNFILHALAFEPNERFQRAQDFSEGLAASFTASGGAGSSTVQTKADLPPDVGGLPNTAAAEEPPTAQNASVPELATAHVLFIDIVGYSNLLIDQQAEQVKDLQELVRGTREFQANPDVGRLLRLPTGDGMALSFFSDAEAPVRCAAEISRALRSRPDLKVRMGLHSGLVLRLADINANLNIAGGGINIAQRVMDCGDAGHILLSSRLAEDIGQLSRWKSSLHDLGETQVKHGLNVHIYNLYNEEIGNSDTPLKLRPRKSTPRWVFRGAALAVGLLLILLAGFAIFSGARDERVLNYSLTVQKVRDGQLYDQPFQSSGQEIFENGYKFRLNVSSPQSGYLYVFNEGAGDQGSLSFTIIYPTPATNKGSAKVDANQPIQTNWNTFAGQAGTEEFWMVWSASPVNQLEAARDVAFKNEEGAVPDAAMVRVVKEFLTKHSEPKPEATKDTLKKQTDVRTSGNLLVTLLQLEHR